ncbi:hypothetical protein L1987_81028 [Smallanthus sonchifolius]|uniref:Uncharacterized protein n=1 Tax=Smallanthus sonchifolius TaxID=185202 RepID=A0ACB8YQD5_9ASTR|nr:hypothetical protein L1987_81028 [Smallanthus sonchifolius]
MKPQTKQARIGNFFKRKFNDDVDIDGSPNIPNVDIDGSPNIPSNPSIPNIIDDLNLPSDPFDRPPIASYHPNQIDEIRRHYLVKKAFQPRKHKFPSKMFSGQARHFVVGWFDTYPWLEYSIKADKAYCLYCYLFKETVGNQGGRDTFSCEGFCNWSKGVALRDHVRSINSSHNKAMEKCENLLKQERFIHVKLNAQTEEEKLANRLRLMGSVRSARYLLENGLPFRGHDESETSISKGLFLSTLKFLSDNNPEIGKHTLGKAKKNNKLTAPSIQKEIIDCFAKEVTKMICKEIKDDVFGLLIDESSDVSLKEQMTVVVRYVDKLGVVKESFIGIAHVKDTSSTTLKQAVVSLLADNQLSIDQVRGQGYDGASNMRGEFNGLKALILRDNPSAHYIHCFAHQLQLVIVAVAKKHPGVQGFYEYLSMVVNTVSASCKRKDMLREARKERVEKEIFEGVIKTGKGLNQEVSLARAGDTRWGSHHGTITSLIKLFSEVVDVLHYVKEEGDSIQQRSNAKGILSYFKKLEFVFYAHLMEDVLSITNALSKHLQKKSQDLLEAANMINGTKGALNELRQKWFDEMLIKVTSFCQKYNITMLDMMASYGNPRNRKNVITNRHHFEVEIFNTVLDMQIQEMGNRFNEVTTTLIENMSGLNPCDWCSKFDTSKIVTFSEMYPNDFTTNERVCLLGELKVLHHSVKKDDRFANLDGIFDLARLMVETGKNKSYPLVYRILKLALVLPVATATVERCFSKMKLIKTDLRNRMGDEFLNNALVCSIEREIFDKVTDDDVMARFQLIKCRRGHT